MIPRKIQILPTLTFAAASMIALATLVTGKPGYTVFGVAIMTTLVVDAFVLGLMWNDVVPARLQL